MGTKSQSDMPPKSVSHSRSEGSSLTFAVVLAVWGACSAITIFHVVYSAVNLPLQDDWYFAPVYAGAEPLRFSWLWEPYTGHMYVVTHLVLTPVCRVFDFDYRLIFLLNAVALCAGNLWLLFSVRSARGRATIYDLILPIQGASLVQSWILLLGIGFGNVLFLSLFSVVVGGMLRRFWNSFVLSAAVGLAVVLLSVTMGYGLAASLVLTPYLGAVGLLQLRQGGAARRRGVLTGSLAGVAAAGCAVSLALIFRQDSESVSARPEVGEIFRIASRFLDMAWLGTAEIMPFPNLLGGHGFPVILAVLMVAAWATVLVLRPGERPVLWSLGVALLAILAVAGAVGYGRVSAIRPGLWPWYATAATPFAFVGYLIFDRLPFRIARHGFGVLLLLLGVAALAAGWEQAWRLGAERRTAGFAFLRDARAGVSGAELHRRYHGAFLPYDGKISMGPLLDWLKKERRGPYDVHESMWLPRIRPLFLAETRLAPPDESKSVPRRRVDMPWFKPLEEGGVFHVVMEENWFDLPLSTRREWGRDWLLEMKLLSPEATVARLRVNGRRVQSVPVLRGSNEIQFLIRNHGPGAKTLRFSPGRKPGNYRIQWVRRHNLP